MPVFGLNSEGYSEYGHFLRSVIHGKLLSDRHIVDFGDFNTDILNSTNINLQNVLSNYALLVNEATHISSSLLDHVYVNDSVPEICCFVEGIHASCVNSCYFFL